MFWFSEFRLEKTFKINKFDLIYPSIPTFQKDGAKTALILSTRSRRMLIVLVHCCQRSSGGGLSLAKAGHSEMEAET